jgi:zinc/manganese transport system substrate-binding protein
MKSMILVLMAFSLSAPFEKKKVVVTLPALQSIAEAVGGDDFEVTALSKPDQNPHAVSPTPTLMKKVREADLFIEIGLQLELWADQVAAGSGNPAIDKGGKGRLIASTGISREEVPAVVDRKEGDIHPEGNPHIWIDPIRAKQIADNIAAGLKAASPAASSAIDERLKKFKDRIDEALFGPELVKEVGARTLTRKALDGSILTWLEERKLSGKLGGWLKKAAPLRGAKAVEFHRTWIYLAKLLGLEIVGSIQPKPGVEPGPKHVEELKSLITAQKVKVIIVDNFYPVSVPDALARETGAKVAVVPGQPGGEAGTDDYVKFIGFIIDRLVEAAK